MPMFPRTQEWWALSGMIDEFADSEFTQYWDDELHASTEVKLRLVPEVEDEVPWDIFILFGPDATWADAEDHVVGWGEPVIRRAEELEALLVERRAD